MRPTQSKNIYFDITDIVNFAAAHSTVTGIQRVQLNLISNISRQNHNQSIYCTFFHPHSQTFVSFKPLDIIPDDEFDAVSMLYKLGLYKIGKRIPPKQDIKKYLNKFSKNKIYRAIKKAEVYFIALFNKGQLESLGFKNIAESNRLRDLPQTTPNKTTLKREDIYVILGANWGFRDVINMCKNHATRGGSVIQMVYDLIPYSNPDLCTTDLCTAFENWLNDVSDYVDKFVCISQYTVHELQKFLGEKASTKIIEAVPLAHEFSGHKRNATAIKPRPEISHILEKKFILCVGTIEIRKNGVTLLRAWSRLIQKLGPDTPTLVFAGRKGWLIDEFENALHVSSKLRKFVKIIESPSDGDLVSLYQNCMFTVYPSFSEGWGLPVGESAWFGKFCLGSSATSVPEVCGDLIDYVDPYNISEITEKLLELIAHPEYVKAKEVGIRSAELRTWADVAHDLFKFIERNSAEKF